MDYQIRVKRIPIPDRDDATAELVRGANGVWEFRRSGKHIRDLWRIEQLYVDAALAAARNINLGH